MPFFSRITEKNNCMHWNSKRGETKSTWQFITKINKRWNFVETLWFKSTISKLGNKRGSVWMKKKRTYHHVHESGRKWSSLRARRRVKEKSKAWATRACRAFATLLQLITLLRTSISPSRKQKQQWTKEKNFLTLTKTATGPETHVSLSTKTETDDKISQRMLPKFLGGCKESDLGTGFSFLRYINLCLFLKQFTLSLIAFFSTQKKR